MLRPRALLGVAFLPAQLLAEATLERGPNSHRGAVALAAISWCAAAVVVTLALVRGLRRNSQALPISNSSTARLFSLVRSVLGGTLEVIFGILLVVGLTGLAKLASTPKPTLPAGWTIIRPPQEVSALALQDDTVWAGGTAGIVGINRRTSQIRPTSTGDPIFRYVKDLLVDREGGLWIAHGQGVARFAGGEWKTYSSAEGLPRGPALALLQDRAGTIWIGTEQGAFRYDGHTFNSALAKFAASVIFQARDGVIWLGSDAPENGGLRSFDGQTWREWSTRDGLAHNSINAIAQERDGAIWFATGFANQGGATRYEGGVWKSWTRKDGLAGAKVRSVFQDRESRLWFGSEYDGIAVTNGHTWRVLTRREGLAGREVKKMLQDPDGVYWLATENGISRIETFDWEAVQKGNRQ